ncbi:MAG TPA: glycosyltransferase [Polyangiales bacterium]
MPVSAQVAAFVLTVLAACSLLANFALHWATRRKLRDRPQSQTGFAPPISILKPLCGLDEGLYDNLVSFALQDYPGFELVFGVADPRDPALSAVQRLRRSFPDLPVRIVVGTDREPAVNPKVQNLLRILRVARHEHVLVSDSNVHVARDYLLAIAAEMADPTVGLVSNLIAGHGEVSAGASFENLHLDTVVAGSVSLADSCGVPCVVGKSMLMRRSELAALGGLECMRDVLAEDFVIGQRYHAAGYGVVLSGHRVFTRNRRLAIRAFLARHLRWAQIRRHAAPAAFCCEPVVYLTPWLLALLAVMVAASPQLRLQTAIFALVVSGLRVASDAWLARRLAGRLPALRALAFLPLKDCAMLTVWAVALVRRTVVWRGHALRIGVGSRVTGASHGEARGLHEHWVS